MGDDSDEDIHPLLGTIVEDDIPALVDLPPPPAIENPMLGDLHHIEVPPPRRKTYCESCGHVDSHASGCPRGEALEAIAELDREEAAEALMRAADPEPIIPLMRRIGASLLRRVARIVEPAKR
jgi:hypothetical protein